MGDVPVERGVDDKHPCGGADLDRWLAPFLEVMGRKTRRIWAPLYLRGLLGPRERKSLQPMAAAWGWAGMTSCSTSSPAQPGATRRCGPFWRSRPAQRRLSQRLSDRAFRPKIAVIGRVAAPTPLPAHPRLR
jgi:hypothetical protein